MQLWAVLVAATAVAALLVLRRRPAPTVEPLRTPEVVA